MIVTLLRMKAHLESKKVPRQHRSAMTTRSLTFLIFCELHPPAAVLNAAQQANPAKTCRKCLRVRIPFGYTGPASLSALPGCIISMTAKVHRDHDRLHISFAAVP